MTGLPVLEALGDALGSRASRHEPLGPMTTYGVGGPASLFVELENPDDLDVVRVACRKVTRGSAGGSADLPCFVIGRGSNLLVSDAGFDGLVLRLGVGFAGLSLPEDRSGHELTVHAGAALALPVMARRVADAGLAGLSWAVGVPGSVGGAVRMNAGGHGSDMAQCLRHYTWVDLLCDEEGVDDVTRLEYGYRTSSIGPTQLVLGAELGVVPGSVEGERAAVAEIVRWRREHQPGGSNAGSVFTNPEGDSAGRLIEQAGLKGFRLGTAQVSTKHANFIQADKGGRADDVRALMEYVHDEVAGRTGVDLRAEVRLLGFDGGKTGGVVQREEQSS